MGKNQLNANTSTIREFLWGKREASVSMLASLVRVPSDNPPGDCGPHSELTAKHLEAMGFEVERHEIPEQLLRSKGMRTGRNLVVRHRFGPGPTIALSTHGDVVSPGTGWDFDPYGAQLQDGYLYGRAAMASKSDIVTYSQAILALKNSGERICGSIELHVTYDEEVGGELGPKRLLEQGVTSPDFAICTGSTYSVVSSHNGCLHIEIHLQGKSSHAARPELGVDAIEAANYVLSALYKERSNFGSIKSNVRGITHPTLVVGLINGGVNTNVVPDSVTLRLDRRFLPEEDGDQVVSRLSELVMSAASKVPGVACNIKILMLAHPLVPLPGQERLVRALCASASNALGEEIGSTGAPIYTDARHYCAKGIPTVLYGAGPKDPADGNAHGPNERLKLTDLFAASEVIALSCRSLLLGEED